MGETERMHLIYTSTNYVTYYDTQRPPRANATLVLLVDGELARGETKGSLDGVQTADAAADGEQEKETEENAEENGGGNEDHTSIG